MAVFVYIFVQFVEKPVRTFYWLTVPYFVLSDIIIVNVYAYIQLQAAVL